MLGRLDYRPAISRSSTRLTLLPVFPSRLEAPVLLDMVKLLIHWAKKCIRHRRQRAVTIPPTRPLQRCQLKIRARHSRFVPCQDSGQTSFWRIPCIDPNSGYRAVVDTSRCQTVMQYLSRHQFDAIGKPIQKTACSMLPAKAQRHLSQIMR